MTAKFTLLNVDLMEAEMTIRMTVHDWKKVRAILNTDPYGESWMFSQKILDLVNEAERVFESKDTPTKNDSQQ